MNPGMNAFDFTSHHIGHLNHYKFLILDLHVSFYKLPCLVMFFDFEILPNIRRFRISLFRAYVSL